MRPARFSRSSAAYAPPTLRERGAALVEMAILLPVLVVCFWGVAEIGQYLMMAERMTKTVNQLSAVLYTLRPSDLQSGGTANTVIGAAIREAETLAKPFPTPTITVRYCQRRGAAGALEQIYFGTTTPPISGCEKGPECQESALTKNGYGAYVQVYACQHFQPALTPRYFKTASANGTLVKQVAFIPLTDTNQTALIKAAGGVLIPVVNQPTTCGGAGQPVCPTPNPPAPPTPPVPTPTCGTAGQPVCPVQCSWPQVKDKNGGCVTPVTCNAPATPDGFGGCTTPNPTPPTRACPTGYTSGNGGNSCYINPSCTPGAPGCTNPCPSPSQLINGACQTPNSCTSGQIVDTNTGNCVSYCPSASSCPSGARNPTNCSCLPQPTCTAPQVAVGMNCITQCPPGQQPGAGGACEASCKDGYFYQGQCVKNCDPGYEPFGGNCVHACSDRQSRDPITGTCM